MQNRFSRSEIVLGKDALDILAKARVAVFGAGGVGGYVIEALARSGVGTIDIIDNDTINETNINRQIYALSSSIGKYKVDVAKERCLDINPGIKINTYKTFYMPDTSSEFDFKEYDYIVDAIDTVTAKIELIVNAKKADTPIISCMGAGNKLFGELFEVSDIYKTSMCPLAKVMRYELKRRGIKKLKVVYSKEKPIVNTDAVKAEGKKAVPGSVAFVPPVAGLIAAGEVIRDLCGYR